MKKKLTLALSAPHCLMFNSFYLLYHYRYRFKLLTTTVTAVFILFTYILHNTTTIVFALYTTTRLDESQPFTYFIHIYHHLQASVMFFFAFNLYSDLDYIITLFFIYFIIQPFFIIPLSSLPNVSFLYVCCWLCSFVDANGRGCIVVVVILYFTFTQFINNFKIKIKFHQTGSFVDKLWSAYKKVCGFWVI